MVSENIRATPKVIGNSKGEGVLKAIFRKESVKLNIWNFQRGGVLNQKPSMRGVWIFHEIIHFGALSHPFKC